MVIYRCVPLKKISQRGTFTKPTGLSFQQEIATTKKACRTYYTNGGNKKAGTLPAFLAFSTVN
jgi:hypothetical protein